MVRTLPSATLLLAVTLSACGSGSSSAPDSTTNAPWPAQEQLLTGWDILHRSEAAMANIGPFVVESRAWSTRNDEPPPETIIAIYEGASETHVNPYIHAPEGCQVSLRDVTPFSQRSLGSPFESNVKQGGTTPEVVELLGHEILDGADTLILRYEYLHGSIEGAYAVGHTEWIATDDFRLLRIETERWDPLGFNGQIVQVFTEYGEPESIDCPRESTVPEAELKPTTEPRLKPTPRP